MRRALRNLNRLALKQTALLSSHWSGRSRAARFSIAANPAPKVVEALRRSARRKYLNVNQGLRPVTQSGLAADVDDRLGVILE